MEAARYNWFVVLYPVGAVSEWMQMYRHINKNYLNSLLLVIWPIGIAFCNII